MEKHTNYPGNLNDVSNVDDQFDVKTIYSPHINLDFPARISSQLFNYGQYRWKMAVRPFRLLMMVTQTLAMEKQQTPLLFPEYVFPLSKVFEYMGIANNNKRYDLLAADIKELMSTVIEKKEKSKKGKFKWIGKTLISMCKIDSEDSSLRIKINEESRDYLVGMKRWSEIQPRIYLKLNTAYQNWFYAYFKKELYLIENSNNKVKITVEISTLKEMLYLDDVKTYNESKNANEKFFNKVIGIKKPKTWKYNSKDELNNEPWDYYTEDNKSTGTLYAITTSTDINVTAFPIKEGKSYNKICFVIGNKKTYITKDKIKKLDNLLKRTTTSETVSSSKRKRTAASKLLMEDLFNNPQYIESCENPLNEKNVPRASHIEIPREVVIDMLNNYNATNPNRMKTIEEFGEELGYQLSENGNFIRDINKPLNVKR